LWGAIQEAFGGIAVTFANLRENFNNGFAVFD
jgi:hypothetical protein